MSEQRPESDEYDVASSGAPAEGYSSNGTHPDAAIGIAESTEGSETAETAEGASADEPAAEAETADAEAPTADATERIAAEPAPDEGTTFLAELARAMQATADVERTRIGEDADRRREAHLAAIQARRETEAATMRQLAAEELEAIDAWAQGERQRIDLERERRAAALQEDLETSLTVHGSKIDSEVESVETAIAQYRTEVDGFFATLGQETDPVEIARHASRRPAFPDLEAIGMSAVEAEEPAVAVMDPEARDPDPAVAWSQWNEPTATVDATQAPAETPVDPVETAADPAEPVSVTASSTDQPASGGLLQSVPAHRPFGFLRGDRNESE